MKEVFPAHPLDIDLNVNQDIYLRNIGAQIKPLVDNADGLLKWSKRLLGEPIVNGILRRTFFRHFCAGI